MREEIAENIREPAEINYKSWFVFSFEEFDPQEAVTMIIHHTELFRCLIRKTRLPVPTMPEKINVMEMCREEVLKEIMAVL
uniref:Uncharacterized protein n=1 Tax=Salix viminalis TaxID=40686 RepID=A0A6N2MJS6_SALVM